jgi:hypothetical protein
MRVCCGVQQTVGLARRQLTAQEASTSTPLPSPTQDQQSGRQGPKSPNGPSTSAAGTPRQTRTKPTNHRVHEVGAGSSATPDAQDPSDAQDRKGSGRGAHGRGPSRAKKVWACAACGTTAQEMESGRLQQCSGCRSVRYCGKACQNADWPRHKATCKRLQAGQG